MAGCGNDNAIPIPLTTGLPCDVQRVLEDNCQGCHGEPPVNAPMPLVSYDDLTQYVGAVPMAQLAVERMLDGAKPMPPTPFTSVPAGDVAILQAWIDSGMPRGTCAPGPFGVGERCTSGQTRGGVEGSNMRPGEACLGCHRAGEERLTLAGTVYPTGHEPNQCVGASGVTVEITEATGVKHSLPVSGGNFHYSRTLALPYTARVISADGRVRAMMASQTNGDCNSCHTQDGAMNAPGRIVAP